MNKPARARPLVLQCITRLGLGGSERVAFSLMRELAPEIDFALFTAYAGIDDAVGRAMEGELKSLGVSWFPGTHVPMKKGGMIFGGWALHRAIEEIKPDLIHYHGETPEACGAVMMMLSPANARIPSLRTIHNSVFWRYWPRTGRWCDRRLRHALVACVSDAARTEFIRYRQDSGASTTAITPDVVYNGVRLPVLAPHDRPHNPTVRRVLFAGRLDWEKGPDILSAALPQVRLPDGVHAELVVHGKGKLETSLRALANQPPPNWSVTVHPPVMALEKLLPQFDVLVMPSRFEGLGLVAIEATLCGVPVVATRAPGLSETLPPDHPWLVTTEDVASLAGALTRVLAETDRWESAVTAAQQHARTRFTPGAMAAGYRKFYAIAN